MKEKDENSTHQYYVRRVSENVDHITDGPTWWKIRSCAISTGANLGQVYVSIKDNEASPLFPLVFKSCRFTGFYEADINEEKYIYHHLIMTIFLNDKRSNFLQYVK